MKKYGKSGRPGKRRRNMPGYRLGVDRIGRKAWLVNRRPEDIEAVRTKRDFIEGRVEVGSIFALSKTSNAVFLGIHQGRILYYNPKTDRVGHTGLGRTGGRGRSVSVLKEKVGLDYFKSENDWMNHRKIPGSDLRVSDVLTNPYRKTIAKKPGEQFTMLDYHKSAIVGDILLGNQTGLKAEVIAITKRGMTVKVDDGSPDGRIGHVNLKNRAYQDRQYTMVKSALEKDLSIENLQDKFKKSKYRSVETEGGGSTMVKRDEKSDSKKYKQDKYHERKASNMRGFFNGKKNKEGGQNNRQGGGGVPQDRVKTGKWYDVFNENKEKRAKPRRFHTIPASERYDAFKKLPRSEQEKYIKEIDDLLDRVNALKNRIHPYDLDTKEKFNEWKKENITFDINNSQGARRYGGDGLSWDNHVKAILAIDPDALRDDIDKFEAELKAKIIDTEKLFGYSQVGDVFKNTKTGLSGEILTKSKKGVVVKIDDGTPEGEIGHVDFTKSKQKDAGYLKTNENSETPTLKELQKKLNSDDNDVFETDGGSSVVARRGRPAGSTNRPLTDEEKKSFNEKAKQQIDELKNFDHGELKWDESLNDTLQKKLGIVKKIISYSNKSGDSETNEKYKKIRQNLLYKKNLNEKYDQAQTNPEKLAAAKAALKYEERVGGEQAVKDIWAKRIQELGGEKPETNKKVTTEETETSSPDASNKKIKKVDDNPAEENKNDNDSGPRKLEAMYGDDLELAKELDKEAEKYKDDYFFKNGYKKLSDFRMFDLGTKIDYTDSIRTLISEIEGALSRNKWGQYDEKALNYYSMMKNEYRRNVVGYPRFNPDSELSESERSELLGRRQWLIDNIKPKRVDQETQNKINNDSEKYKDSLDYREGRIVVDSDVSFFLGKDGNLDVLRIEREIGKIESHFKRDETNSIKLKEKERGFMHGRRAALLDLLNNKDVEKTKMNLDIPASLEKELEKRKKDPKFMQSYDYHKRLDGAMFQFINNIQERWDKRLLEVKNALDTGFNIYTGGLFPLRDEDRTTLLAEYKAMLELKQAREMAASNKTGQNTENVKKVSEKNDSPVSKSLSDDKLRGYKTLSLQELITKKKGDKFFAYDLFQNKVVEVNVETDALGKLKYRTPLIKDGKVEKDMHISIKMSNSSRSHIPMEKMPDPDYHPKKTHSLISGDLIYLKDKGVYRVDPNNEKAYLLNAETKNAADEVKIDNLKDDDFETIKTPENTSSPLSILRDLFEQTHLVVHKEDGNMALEVSNYNLKYDKDKKSLRINAELKDQNGNSHKIDVDGDSLSKNNLFDLDGSISSMNLKYKNKQTYNAPFPTPVELIKQYGISKAMSHMCVPGLRNEIELELQNEEINYRNKLYSNDAYAGFIERTIKRDVGWQIHNEVFELPSSIQGNKIAQRFYDNQTKLAKRLGVTHMKMLCGLEVGGYAWATRAKGFDFDKNNGDAKMIKNKIISDVADMTLDDWKLFHPTATVEVMNAQKRAIADELNKRRLDEFGFPTNQPYYDSAKAYEFAEFSHSYLDENGNKITVKRKRDPKSTKDRDDRLHPLGKSSMLGEAWKGVKRIDDSKHSGPEWSISTIEAAVPEPYESKSAIKN